MPDAEKVGTNTTVTLSGGNHIGQESADLFHIILSRASFDFWVKVQHAVFDGEDYPTVDHNNVLYGSHWFRGWTQKTNLPGLKNLFHETNNPVSGVIFRLGGTLEFNMDLCVERMRFEWDDQATWIPIAILVHLTGDSTDDIEATV
jgi:hypothetical protein